MPVARTEAETYSWWSNFLEARMFAIQSMIALGRSEVEIYEAIGVSPEQASMLIAEARGRQQIKRACQIEDSMEKMYLIEKRGLYYRPNAQGYTGLKSDAGRYTLEDVALHFPNMDSPNQDGMTFVSEQAAPEYSTRCPWDVQMKREAYIAGYLDATFGKPSIYTDKPKP